MTRTHHTLVDPACRCGHSEGENGPNLVRLDPESVAAIADAVTERLSSRDPDPLLTVEGVAHLLSVSPAWVYENAGRLGALELSDGARPRLRFDRERVLAALTSRSSGKRSQAKESPENTGNRRRRRSRPMGTGGGPVPLLPIDGPRDGRT